MTTLSVSRKLLLSTQRLASLRPSSLFLCSPPLTSKMRAKKNKPHVFLPHLVASMEEVEETYIMIKPDGVQRGLVGEIISRFEKKGFKLKGLKLFQCPKELAEEHYKDLQAKPFFPKLTEYIRGDLAVQTGRNVIHGSDSPENGKHEIDLWFK